MLLIGLDGTGKSTIMELASFISNCDMHKLSVKKGYNYNDFRDDLKNVFKLAGIQKKKIVLFISDKDIYEVNMKIQYFNRIYPISMTIPYCTVEHSTILYVTVFFKYYCYIYRYILPRYKDGYSKRYFLVTENIPSLLLSILHAIN